MTRKHALIVYSLYLLLCIYLLLLGPVTSPDTATYFDAWRSICSTGIDLLRTPVYPIFIGLIQSVTGAKLCTQAVVVCQMLIFGISISYFYKAAYMLTQRSKLCLMATLWYVLSPSCYNWLRYILTEALSIALVTIFVYLTIRIWKYAITKGVAVAYGVILTLLLFLRPSFVYLIPATLILCVLYYIKHKVIAKSILASVIIPAVLLIAYCGVIYSNVGIFTPSIVSMNNKIAIFKQSGINDFDYIQDPDLKADMVMLTSNPEGYECMDYAIKRHGLMPVYQIASQYAAKYPAIYVSKTIGRFYKLMYSDYSVESGLDTVLYPLVIKGKGIITICIVYILAIIYCMRKKHMPYLSITLILMALGNISVTVLGADAEFLRLVSVSMPLYMLFTLQIIDLINRPKSYAKVMA